MQAHPLPPSQSRRVVAGLPFVEALARRLAASMPHSIDIGDLVQDGVLGLIDAAHRFDEDRGIKFETFAERRVRGAMIDALRREAWPRGVRRQRRELEAARETLRRELGHEPSLADLAARVGSDEKRLGRTILRINTIESTSPLAAGDHLDETSLPAALVPVRARVPRHRLRAHRGEGPRPRGHRLAAAARAEADRPLLLRRSDDEADRRRAGRERVAGVAAARAGHPAAAPGARAAPSGARTRRSSRRSRRASRAGAAPGAGVRAAAGDAEGRAAGARGAERAAGRRVLPYASSSRAVRSKSASLNGLASQRQPLSSRKRSASVPTTSPVTKMTRRASDGLRAAIAR